MKAFYQIPQPDDFRIRKFLTRVLLITLIASGLHLNAQEKPDFRTTDSLTFQFYEAERWQELINAGKEALHLGHDYYYLRMRIGIAYYMLGRYRAAAGHFEKALEFNSSDKIAYNYLHQCYQWGVMPTEAAHLSKRFQDVLPDAGENRQFFKELFIISGVSISGSESKLQDLNIAGNEGIYGEVNLGGNMIINHAGANLSPEKEFLWYIGYTNIQLAKHQRIVASGMDTLNKIYTLRQHQAFASFPIRYAKGWQIIPAVNLIRIHNDAIYLSYDSVAQDYSSQKSHAIPLNYVFSFKAIKDLPHLSLGPTFGYSRLNFNDQLQLSFDVNIFPFANLNLYTFSRIATNYENGQVRNHFKQTIGGRITDWLWLQGSYHSGEIKNAHDENGMLVYNMAGSLQSRSSAAIYFLMGPKITLKLEYSFIKHQDEYLEYTDNINFTLKPVQYNNHQFMGGLKWKL